MTIVRIDRLVVRRDRIACFATFPRADFRDSTPDMAQRLVARFPTLPEHTCVNEVGETFGAVLEDTPLPHVLEHVVIDLQARAEQERCGSDLRAPGSRRDPVFVGTSEWIDERAGTARIETSFADDLVALAAFRDAACIINELGEG